MAARDAYQRMKQLGITNVDQFNAIGLTAQPIDLAYLLELLNFRNMLRKTDGNAGDERWKGTLQNLKAALIGLGLADKVAEYEMWFSHVTNPRQFRWDTTQPAFAAGFSEMKRNFADQPSMPTTADFLAVAALGGGFLSITQQEYDQLKADEEAAEAARIAAEEAATARNDFMRDIYNPAWNAFIAPVLDSGSALTRDAMATAFEAAAAQIRGV